MNKKLEEGKEFLQNRKIAEAIPVFEAAILENPSDSQATFLLGICYFRISQLDKAEKLFQKVVSLNSRHHNTLYYLGLISEKQNKLDDAVKYYKLALSIKPDFNEAKEKLITLGEIGEKPGETIKSTRESNKPAVDSDDVASSPLSEVIKQGKDVSGKRLHEVHPRISSFRKTFSLLIAAIIFLFAYYIDTSRYRPYGLSVGEHNNIAINLIFILIIFSCLKLLQKSTKYTIFEYRIDIKTGVLNRKENSIWLYEIQDTSLTRSLYDVLTNNSKIHLYADPSKSSSVSKLSNRGEITISGIGDYKKMKAFWEEIRNAALRERRGMKQILT